MKEDYRNVMGTFYEEVGLDSQAFQARLRAYESKEDSSQLSSQADPEVEASPLSPHGR